MRTRRLLELLGTDLPIIQAPMAGVQLSAMTIAVSNAGALGSLPCAMLAPNAMQAELNKIKAGSAKPQHHSRWRGARAFQRRGR
jgi:nitronate monooxygenase